MTLLTFQVCMTVLFALSAFISFDSIDKPREPISAAGAWGSAIISAIIIFGIWRVM